MLAAALAVAATPATVPLPEAVMPGLAPLIETALAKSPKVMARDFDRLNAQYLEMVSSARLYPQVGGNYQYQLRQEERGGGGEKFDVNRSYFNFSVSQSVWHWGTVRAAARVGELGALIAEHNLDAVRREVALEVRSAYLGLILQKLAVRNSRFNEQLAKENLVRQEEGYKNRESTAGAVADARLRAEDASLSADRAASDFEFSVRAFRTLTGIESFSAADLPETITPPGAELETVTVGNGYMKSEALLVRELQVEQGKLNYRIARKSLWPKVNAVAGVTQDDNLYSSTLDRRISNIAAYVGVQVQWTIFDGFASKGRRLQNRSNVLELEKTREGLLSSLKDSADQQAANVGFSWRAYQNMNTRRRFATGRLNSEKANLERGLSSEEQIAAAQGALYQAEWAACDALAKFYSASSRYSSTMRSDPMIDGESTN